MPTLILPPFSSHLSCSSFSDFSKEEGSCLQNFSKDSYEWKNFKWIIIITVLEILSGAIMGYLDVPKFAQPLHVILSSILLLVQTNLFFRIFWNRNIK